MKNRFYFSLLPYLTLMIFLEFSCTCRNITCNEDIPLPECIVEAIPHQVGDNIVFKSSTGDSMILECETRDILDMDFKYHGSQIANSCCDDYIIEWFRCQLVNDQNTLIEYFVEKIGTGSPYTLYLSISNDTIDEGATLENKSCPQDEGLFVHSIELAGKNFTNLSKACGQNPNNEFYFSRSGLGIVGFEIDGIEWARQ